MKTVIHVNQHVIRANNKSGARNPVLTVKTYKSNTYAHEAIILDKEGNECARVVYSPDKPLSCGARVWIETYNGVEINDQRVSIPENDTSKKLEHSIKLLDRCVKMSEEQKALNVAEMKRYAKECLR